MSRLENVRTLLVARSGEWVDGRELARVGGFAAWRTRLSDCRRQFGMRIENETIRHEHYTVTRYRYLPQEPV